MSGLLDVVAAYDNWRFGLTDNLELRLALSDLDADELLLYLRLVVLDLTDDA